jgi:hypothetical protein
MTIRIRDRVGGKTTEWVSEVRTENDPLHSIPSSAEFLGGISPWTVRAWISRGLIMRTKVGGRTFVRESELRRMIRDGEKSPAPRRSEWR